MAHVKALMLLVRLVLAALAVVAVAKVFRVLVSGGDGWGGGFVECKGVQMGLGGFTRRNLRAVFQHCRWEYDIQDAWRPYSVRGEPVEID